MASTATKKETKKKICPVCKKEKPIATGFYKSSSPLFALDGCVPICIDCVKNDVVNEDGTVNENKLKTMCQRLDKPFYSDELDSAFLQAKFCRFRSDRPSQCCFFRFRHYRRFSADKDVYNDYRQPLPKISWQYLVLLHNY